MRYTSGQFGAREVLEFLMTRDWLGADWLE
jgi:hypothetical protein